MTSHIDVCAVTRPRPPVIMEMPIPPHILCNHLKTFPTVVQFLLYHYTTSSTMTKGNASAEICRHDCVYPFILFTDNFQERFHRCFIRHIITLDRFQTSISKLLQNYSSRRKDGEALRLKGVAQNRQGRARESRLYYTII